MAVVLGEKFIGERIILVPRMRKPAFSKRSMTSPQCAFVTQSGFRRMRERSVGMGRFGGGFFLTEPLPVGG